MNKNIFICLLLASKLILSSQDHIAQRWIKEQLPAYTALIQRAQSPSNIEEQRLVHEARNAIATAIDLYGYNSIAAKRAEEEYHRLFDALPFILIIHNPKPLMSDRSPTSSQPQTGSISTETIAAPITFDLNTPTIQSPTTTTPSKYNSSL